MTDSPNALVTLADMTAAGDVLAATFGITRPAAVALMLIGQAEGMHPVRALQMYDIIEGKPRIKSEALLSKFQDRGGRVRWSQFDDIAAVADFMHPNYQPEWVKISVTWDEMSKTRIPFGQNGVKANWLNARGAMLRARLIAKAVRMIDPGAIAGMIVPEEDDGDSIRTVDGVVVATEGGESARHAAARKLTEEADRREAETTAAKGDEPCTPAPSAAAPAAVAPAAPATSAKAASDVPPKPTSSNTSPVKPSTPAAPAPTKGVPPVDQSKVPPSLGPVKLPALLPLAEGAPVTVDHLTNACQRLIAAYGAEKALPIIGNLNVKHGCVPLKEGQKPTVGTCPADNRRTYLADVEEEIGRWQAEQRDLAVKDPVTGERLF